MNKKLLAFTLSLPLLGLSSYGINWTNYPVVTEPAGSDTFLIGTATTNQQITATSVLTWTLTNAYQLTNGFLWTNLTSAIASEAVHATNADVAATVAAGVTNAWTILTQAATNGFLWTNLTAAIASEAVHATNADSASAVIAGVTNAWATADIAITNGGMTTNIDVLLMDGVTSNRLAFTNGLLKGVSILAP